MEVCLNSEQVKIKINVIYKTKWIICSIKQETRNFYLYGKTFYGENAAYSIKTQDHNYSILYNANA